MAMHKIRVLLVDDSVVVRRVVGELLAEEPGVEVVGTAPDGRIALDKAARTSPDVVVLDLEMPGMNGIDMLRQVMRKLYPVPVIVVSSHSTEGASVTLKALGFGAFDFAGCLSWAGHLDHDLRQFPRRS